VVRIDPQKLHALQKLHQPEIKNVTQLRRFLGMTNCYRKFIAQFAQITKPLTQLLQKDTQWSWDYEQEQAWNKVLEVLEHYCGQEQGEIQVYTDFSQNDRPPLTPIRAIPQLK